MDRRFDRSPGLSAPLVASGLWGGEHAAGTADGSAPRCEDGLRAARGANEVWEEEAALWISLKNL